MNDLKSLLNARAHRSVSMGGDRLRQRVALTLASAEADARVVSGGSLPSQPRRSYSW